METLRLSQITAVQAASALAGCQHLDPRGMATANSTAAMAANGLCFAAETDTGSAVYVLDCANGVAWVSACKGSGVTDWCAALLPTIERQAAGLQSVGFQTSRRGLVKKAKKHGYTVTGWILKKGIK